MMIFYKDQITGIEAGINDDGDLFFGDQGSGYTLSDTANNRNQIKRDFEKYTGRTIEDCTIGQLMLEERIAKECQGKIEVYKQPAGGVAFFFGNITIIGDIKLLHDIKRFKILNARGDQVKYGEWFNLEEESVSLYCKELENTVPFGVVLGEINKT